MGMRINYNGAAANAWRNLGINDDNLQGSVAKLSSGLRINKGADDPAGLIISERLKAQITGLGQAVQNAQEATSLVQTAEGALTEMNNMLNKMRGLAVHSSNEGVQDADSIAADQKQVDSALDSLQKIAVNTKFQAKTLLDGSAANSANIDAAQAAQYESIDIKGSADDILGSVDVNVTTAATRANSAPAQTITDHDAGTLTITSSNTSGEVTVDFLADATATQIADSVNNFYDQTGVWASVTTGQDQLQFTSDEYGADSTFTIKTDAQSVIGTTVGGDIVTAVGSDIIGNVVITDKAGAADTLNATGDGLTLTVDASEAQLQGTEVTVVGADQSVATDAERQGTGVTGGNTVALDTDLFSVTEGALKFSLGQDASADEIRSISISNMQVANLGKGSAAGSGSLDDIKSGGSFSLANDAQNAIKIIDQAINDVSIARADLGAFQQNALETTIKTLNINKENLEASNSRITDVDMAQEMMKFTRSQILTQAGTSMLAQANQLPQSVLQLLG